jgi:hypothetical protein
MQTIKASTIGLLIYESESKFFITSLYSLGGKGGVSLRLGLAVIFFGNSLDSVVIPLVSLSSFFSILSTPR